MATIAKKTPHKEIHEEQAKREKMEDQVEKAKDGRLPDNKQVTKGIDKVKEGLNKENDQLSKTGKNVTKDINNILDTTQKILNEKNEGNLLQNTYYHTQKTGSNKSYSERIAELREIATGDPKNSREEARKNVSSMGTIVKLALISPEFRETVNDMAKIINLLLKRQSDKNSGKEPCEDENIQLKAKTVTETNTIEKSIRDDGKVEASVVETAPKTKIEKVSKSKKNNKEIEEKLVNRLIDLAQTLHKNPEYRNSIEYMANSASKLKKFSSEESKIMKEKKKIDKCKENESETKHHEKQARINTKLFVENWIGSDYSLDLLIRNINILYEKSKEDSELKNLLQEWKNWLTLTVKDSEYVADKQKMRNDILHLLEETKKMNERYKEQVYIIRKEVNYINRSIQRDDTLTKLHSDFSKLGKDILRDENGQPIFKAELLQDSQIILGAILEAIKYIPLPPIRRNDPNMEIELENIVLNATDVTPSNVRFIVKADTDQNKTGSRQANNSFLIEISKIRAHLTSVNFFIHKKSGFPKIMDRGLADIDLIRNGLSLVIEIVPKFIKNGNEVHSVFETKTVRCSIDKLKIHLRETSHDTLYKVLSPVINMAAKKKIENGISDYIAENLDKINNVGSKHATHSAVKANEKLNEKKSRSNEEMIDDDRLYHEKNTPDDLEPKHDIMPVEPKHDRISNDNSRPAPHSHQTHKMTHTVPADNVHHSIPHNDEPLTKQ